ncbi:hypothetical protein P9112_002991 [Eukaryota sp. TZLM1-RC]
MSDICQRNSPDISHSANIIQQGEKQDSEVLHSVPTSSFNLFFTQQQSSFSRTPQSGTVVLRYKNKRKIRASISHGNRRFDPSMEVEYCTFFSHYVSHDVDAVESAILIITLDMRCFFLF